MLHHLLEPFRPSLADAGTTDIVVNKPGEFGVEANGEWSWYDEPSLDYDWLLSIAILAAFRTGQDVSASQPLCSTALPGGERLQVCIPSATAPGVVSMSIRRPPSFRPRLSTLGGLFENTGAGTLERLVADAGSQDKLREAVVNRKNIIICGATGSGKTTLAKALIEEKPLHERLVTIEDTPEWNSVPHRNRVALYYSKGGHAQDRLVSEDLIEASLRMRPDRVLMQELRDGAAFSYLRGIAAGHPGCITTLHAGSARGAFDALRLMVRQNPSGATLESADVDKLLSQLVDVVIHCARQDNQFRVTEIIYNG
jgi:type IV secretion system protein VirB11